MRKDEKFGRRTARRKPSKFAYFLLLLMLALCAAAVCVAVFFKVETISVSNKSSYSKEQVISSSGIKKGTSLFRVDKELAVKKICSSLPFAADAKIKLSPPSTIEIEVIADSPKYVIKSSKQYAYVDENMKALVETTDTKKYTNVITINGAEIAKFKAGSAIVLKDTTQAATIKTLAAAVKEAKLTKITGMNVADSYQLSIVYDSRITIIIGTHLEADKKLKDAAAIIGSELQSSDKGSLDVSAQNKRYTFSPS
jgi:cell division protein FtsQ